MTGLSPGGSEARKRGCTCDPKLNEKGEGAFHSDSGSSMHFIEEGCPVHWHEDDRGET